MCQFCVRAQVLTFLADPLPPINELMPLDGENHPNLAMSDSNEDSDSRTSGTEDDPSSIAEMNDIVDADGEFWDQAVACCSLLAPFRDALDSPDKVTDFMLPFAVNEVDALELFVWPAMSLFLGLTKVDLRGNNIGEPEALALSGLLEGLPLETFLIGLNNVGDTGLGYLMVDLTVTSLRRLDLQSVGMRYQGAQTLSAVLPRARQLEALDISGNALSIIGSERLDLRPLRNLHELNLSAISCGNAGISSISRALPGMTHLRTLNLSKNNIGSEGAGDLSVALTGLPLSALILDDNLLNGLGGSMLALALRDVPTLQTLGLARTKMSSRAVRNLAQSLTHLPLLTELRLWETSLASGSDLMVDACSVLTFRTLNLWDTRLDPADLPPLITEMAPQPSLYELYLGGCDLSQCGAALSALLSDAKRLTVLSVPYCGLDKAGCIALTSVLPSLPALRELHLQGNPLGRMGGLHLARAIDQGGAAVLEALYLQECGLDDIACRRVAEAVKAWSLCERVQMWGNNLTLEGAERLVKVGKERFTVYI